MRPAMVEKQQIIDQIHEQIMRAKTTIIAQYQGLDVSEITILRKQLKAAGAELKIYKNNLFERALIDSNYQDLGKELIGPNAFIFGYENDLETAKILAKFGKQNKQLKLKGGIFESKVVKYDELITIASLPPKETLISMFLSCLQAPVRKLAVAIKAVAEQKEPNSN